MKLVIVESPTKAKTLSQILSTGDYLIKASMGHIRDLPKSGLGVDVDHNFEPEYVVPSKAKKTLSELKSALKEVDEIILATDPDRKGRQYRGTPGTT
jgi:DNA topoisomerase-1